MTALWKRLSSFVEVALVPFGSLLAALAEVRDPRRAQGQRYSMRHLLLFSVLAVLTGATSYPGPFSSDHEKPRASSRSKLKALA